MGTSTNGNIAFGIVFEEDFEFPWDEEGYEDYSEWWEMINGFSNPFHIDKQREEWREYNKKWRKENPIPFECENYCSDECPMYILAVPDTVLTNHRGYAIEFLPENLRVDELKLEKFMSFIKEYNLSEENPKWLLFSYWG